MENVYLYQATAGDNHYILISHNFEEKLPTPTRITEDTDMFNLISFLSMNVNQISYVICEAKLSENQYNQMEDVVMQLNIPVLYI